MLSQRRRRLSVLSSACQHAATPQLVSGAETDKPRAPPRRPHPCFPRPRWDWLRLRVCPWKACPPKQAYVYSFDISVFLQPALCRFACRKTFPRKQVEVDSVDTGHHCFFCGCASNAPRFVQGQPKAIFIYFRMKDVDRRIEAIAQVNVESKEEKVERAEFNVPTCGYIAVCQQCRDRQIQSLFPTSSLFSTPKVRLIEIAGLPWKACPPKQAYVYSLDSVFFCGYASNAPRFVQGQPKAIFIYFRMKDVDRRIEAIAQVNVKGGEGWACWVQRANMWESFFLNDQRYVFDGTPHEAA